MAANAHGMSLERGRLRVVLATIVINVVAVSFLKFAPWSDWRTGAALNVIDNCLLLVSVLVWRDAFLGRVSPIWSRSRSGRACSGCVVGRSHAHFGLLDWRRPNDLAIAALDAAGVGSRGSAIRVFRPAIVG